MIKVLTWVIFISDQLVTFLGSICMSNGESFIEKSHLRSDINQHTLVMDWFVKEKILNPLRQSSDQQALFVYKEKSNSRMKYDANNCQKLR